MQPQSLQGLARAVDDQAPEPAGRGEGAHYLSL